MEVSLLRDRPATVRLLSIVVPVYQGEATLETLIREIEPLTEVSQTPNGVRFQVEEVILVHDGAKDNSARVIELLAGRYSFIKPVWLSRNFGQHPATLAGMANSSSPFIATLDEDGQHDPRDLGKMLDVAVETGSQLVYAQPTNQPPQSWFRNRMSGLAKWVFVRLLGPSNLGRFNSFRLVDGEIGRSLAAYCGPGIYLDVALGWVVARSSHCPVEMRNDLDRPSGYNVSKLVAHFLRLVLTSGTQPLRLVSMLGLFSIFVGVGLSLYALIGRFTDQVTVPGWTSIIIACSFFSGCILISLGIIAEYLGAVVGNSMGRPLYLVVSGPPAARETTK